MEEKLEELSAEILLVPSFTERNKNAQGNEHFSLFINSTLCKRIIYMILNINYLIYITIS